MGNLSERDVSMLAEGRYNRRWRKVFIWCFIIGVLFMVGIVVWETNTEAPYYKWTLPDGQEIIGEKYDTPMFWIDGEFVNYVVEEIVIKKAIIAPFTIFLGVMIFAYLAFLLYLRKQQRFAKGVAQKFKETGVVPDTFIDYSPLKKVKKKKR